MLQLDGSLSAMDHFEGARPGQLRRFSPVTLKIIPYGRSIAASWLRQRAPFWAVPASL
jgi:hypothetical protein